MKLFKNRLKWIKKRFSWNYKYALGKWDFMIDEENRYKTIVKFIKQTNIKQPKILDLGCGYGALNKFINKDDYSYCLGVDISDNAIHKAKKENYPNSEFVVADIHKFVPNDTFDIIIFNEVLYYLDNQMEIVSQYAKYSKNKGYFIFSFYGIRNDLITEIGKNYNLIESEIVATNKNDTSWAISIYEIKNN